VLRQLAVDADIGRGEITGFEQCDEICAKGGEIRADIKIVPLRIFVLGALNWTIEWFRLNNRDAVLKLARRMELLIFERIERG
jgi:hypothetical protein